jgi:hypothetical protein
VPANESQRKGAALNAQHNSEMLRLLDVIGHVCDVADAWGVLADSWIDESLAGCQLVILNRDRRQAVLVLDGPIVERKLALDSLINGQLQGLSGRAASAASEFRMDLYAARIVTLVLVSEGLQTSPEWPHAEIDVESEMVRLCRNADLSVVPSVTTVVLEPSDTEGRRSFGSSDDLIEAVGDSVFDRALLAWDGDPHASRESLYATHDLLRINSVELLSDDAVLAAWFLRGSEAISLGYTGMDATADAITRLLSHRGAIALLVAGIGATIREVRVPANVNVSTTTPIDSADLASDVLDLIWSANAAASQLLLAVDRNLEDRRRVNAAIDRFVRAFTRSIDRAQVERLLKGAHEYSSIIVSRFIDVHRSEGLALRGEE